MIRLVAALLIGLLVRSLVSVEHRDRGTRAFGDLIAVAHNGRNTRRSFCDRDEAQKDLFAFIHLENYRAFRKAANLV